MDLLLNDRAVNRVINKFISNYGFIQSDILCKLFLC